MGEQLRNLGEAQFARATAVGAQPSFGDWRVAPELLSGSLAAAAAELSLELPTSQKAMPPMYTNATEKTGPIAPLNGNSLEVAPSKPAWQHKPSFIVVFRTVKSSDPEAERSF